MLYKEAESSSVDIIRVLTAQAFTDKLDKAQSEILRAKPQDLPRQVHDISGKVYNRITVLDYAGRRGNNTMWLCLCECGETKLINGAALKNGAIKSCGCLHTEVITIHGAAGKGKTTHEYNTWRAMISRCTHPTSRSYSRHGGRGIKVCERWMDSFENFLADMGNRPDGTSIDRINNDGNYEPGNCRWATRYQQMRNTSTNRWISFNGRTETVATWAEEWRMPGYTLYNKLRYKSMAEIFEELGSKSQIVRDVEDQTFTD